jgi:hypothetical protein
MTIDCGTGVESSQCPLQKTLQTRGGQNLARVGVGLSDVRISTAKHMLVGKYLSLSIIAFISG